MDIEQLKLILQVVDNATDKAVWIALLIIGRSYLTVLCGFGFGAFSVCAILRMINIATKRLSFTKQLGAILGKADFDPDLSSHREYVVGKAQTLIKNESRDKTDE